MSKDGFTFILSVYYDLRMVPLGGNYINSLKISWKRILLYNTVYAVIEQQSISTSTVFIAVGFIGVQ